MNALDFCKLCGKGELLKVQQALKAGVDPNSSDLNKATALMYAASALSPDVIKALVKAGARLNEQDREGRTALIYCLCYYHGGVGSFICKTCDMIDVERVLVTLKTLQELGAQVNSNDMSTFSSLRWKNDLKWTTLSHFFEDAWESQNDINEFCEMCEGCCETGHIRNVLQAIRAGADPNSTILDDGKKRTALMCAASARRPDVIDVLTSSGARPDEQDEEGRTAFSYCFHNGIWERGVSDELRAYEFKAPEENEIACTMDTLKALRKSGGCLSQGDIDGLLRPPVWTGDDSIPRFLILSAVTEEQQRAVEFCELCQLGTVNNVLAAVKLGAEPNAAVVNSFTGTSWTPLMCAAQSHRTDMIKTLICAHANLLWQDGKGRTALSHVFNQYGLFPFVLDSLLNKELDNFKFACPTQQLSEIMETLRTLLRAGLTLSEGDMRLLTASQNAMPPELRDFFDRLIINDGKLPEESTDKDGSSSDVGPGREQVVELCRSGSLEKVRAALRAGADVNLADREGRTPVMYALFRNPDEEVIQLLLLFCDDINAADELGNTLPSFLRGNKGLSDDAKRRLMDHLERLSVRS